MPSPAPEGGGGFTAAAEATVDGGGMGLLFGGALAALAVVAGLALVRRRSVDE